MNYEEELVSKASVLQLEQPPRESKLLVDRIRQWVSVFEDGSFEEKVSYVREVNRRYDALANSVCAQELVELRLIRSHWAKRIAQALMLSVPVATSMELQQVSHLIAALRTLVGGEAVRSLIERQTQFGDTSSGQAIASLLADILPVT